MLELGAPLWLLALPLAVIAPWLGRGGRLRWPALPASGVVHTPRTFLAWLPRFLGGLGLAALVVALARPQLVDRQRVVESEGIDILLVLDVSGSMEAADYRLGGRAASRLDAAKEVIASFVEGRPDDRIGLVVFGEEAFTQVPLTLDHDGLVGFLGQVQIGVAGERSTAIGDAIAVAGSRLADLEAQSRVVILLTDGRNNAGQVEPLQAAEAAASLGIKVYTVGMGSSGGGVFGGLFRAGRGDLDERTLTAIAKLTDAQYFRAQDTTSLAQVYDTIDALETTTAEVQEFVHTEERYHAWVAVGLVLLFMQLVVGETWLRRLP